MLFVLKTKTFCKPEQREDNSYNLAMGQSKFSYELTFWLILIQNSGKQKSKNTLRVVINQFYDGKRDTIRSFMPSTKWEGLSYLTHS